MRTASSSLSVICLDPRQDAAEPPVIFISEGNKTKWLDAASGTSFDRQRRKHLGYGPYRRIIDVHGHFNQRPCFQQGGQAQSSAGFRKRFYHSVNRTTLFHLDCHRNRFGHEDADGTDLSMGLGKLSHDSTSILNGCSGTHITEDLAELSRKARISGLRRTE
jgi:hypothetical protein